MKYTAFKNCYLFNKSMLILIAIALLSCGNKNKESVSGSVQEPCIVDEAPIMEDIPIRIRKNIVMLDSIYEGMDVIGFYDENNNYKMNFNNASVEYLDFINPEFLLPINILETRDHRYIFLLELDTLKIRDDIKHFELRTLIEIGTTDSIDTWCHCEQYDYLRVYDKNHSVKQFYYLDREKKELSPIENGVNEVICYDTNGDGHSYILDGKWKYNGKSIPRDPECE